MYELLFLQTPKLTIPLLDATKSGPENCDYCLFKGDGVECSMCKSFMIWDSISKSCIDSESPTCISFFEEDCNWCSNGMYLEYKENECLKCDDSCIGCYSDGNGFCLSCPIESFTYIEVNEDMEEFIQDYFKDEYNGTRFEDYWETYFYYWSHKVFCLDECPAEDAKGNKLITDYSSRFCLPAFGKYYKPIVATDVQDSIEKSASEYLFSLSSFAAGYQWSVSEPENQKIKGSSSTSVFQSLCLNGKECSAKCSGRGFVKYVSKEIVDTNQFTEDHFVNSLSSKNESFELCVCNNGYQGQTCSFNSNAIQFQRETLEKLLMECEDIDITLTGDAFDFIDALISLSLAKSAFRVSDALVFLKCLQKGAKEGPVQSMSFLQGVSIAFGTLWEIMEQLNFDNYLGSSKPEGNDEAIGVASFEELDSVQAAALSTLASAFDGIDQPWEFQKILVAFGGEGENKEISVRNTRNDEVSKGHRVWVPESLELEMALVVVDPSSVVHNPSLEENMKIFLSSDVLMLSRKKESVEDDDEQIDSEYQFSFQVDISPVFSTIKDPNEAECRLFDFQKSHFVSSGCSVVYNELENLFSCSCFLPSNFTLAIFAQNSSNLLGSCLILLTFSVLLFWTR